MKLDLDIRSATHHLFHGSVRIFSAELLAIPSTVIVLALLTRTLGPVEFGHFALAVAIISWIEWTFNAFFGRASIKIVGELSEWERPAAAMVQLQFFTGLATAVIIVLFAGAAASLLKDPTLSTNLRLFAFDVPFWVTAQAHRSILIARMSFRERSWLSVTRWIGRVLFTVPLVLMFRSVPAAILGWILSSVLELIVARILVSVPWSFPVNRVTWKRFFSYAAPLSVFVLLLRFYDKADLFFLKILGNGLQEIGIYGASQNLSLGVGILAISISTPLLGTLTRLKRVQDEKEISKVVGLVFRGLLLLIPFLSLASASSTELVHLIFGNDFTGAGPSMSLLLFSAFMMVIISTNASILTALERPKLPLLISLPMLPAAIGGYFLIIPSYGGVGAASVSLVVSVSAAVVSTLVAHQVHRVAFNGKTLLRTVLISVVIWWIAIHWQTTGLLLILKFITCGALICILLILMGEFNRKDWKQWLEFRRTRSTI
jgi:O-antigen/teichoic acid export membrane protein